MPEDELSLRDYVAMRQFEAVRPIQVEVTQLRAQNTSLEDEVASLSRKYLEVQKNLEEEHQQHGELRVRYQKTTTDHAETVKQVKVDDYKVENYDRVKSERDNFEHDQLESVRQLVAMEASLTALQKERDDLSRELSSNKQTVALLRQDKDYLSR